MIKKLIFCLLGYGTMHTMHQPTIERSVSATQRVYDQIANAQDEETVMQFLETFDDFNVQINVNELLGTYCDTLLHVATNKGYNAVIKFLIKHGANVNIDDNPIFVLGGRFRRPLGVAICRENGTATVATLLAAGADQHNVFKSISALGLACSVGCAEVVKLLLEYGANPNELNNRKFNGAFYELTKFAPSLSSLSDEGISQLTQKPGGYECARLLLNAGADPTWQGTNGDTALSLAIRNCATNVCQALLQTHNKSRAQVLAELRKQKVNLCAASLALATTLDSFKRRRLRSACVPKYLLAQVTHDGKTPLNLALATHSRESAAEIIKCLTYAEILDAIAIAKRSKRYDTLLEALTNPSNCESIVQEARAHKNYQLIRDMQKRAPTYKIL